MIEMLRRLIIYALIPVIIYLFIFGWIFYYFGGKQKDKKEDE